MKKVYDVIIGGTGPAGMFAALKLTAKDSDLKILMLEKGLVRDIHDKENNLFGWGGAGAFSDGKLTLTSKTGGQLIDRDFLSPQEFKELMDYVDSSFQEFGGKQNLEIGNKENIADLIKRANAAGLELVPYPVRHWGREGAYLLVENIRKHLVERGVEILFDSEVLSIEKSKDKFKVCLGGNKKFSAKHLILAPGRAGSDWLVSQMEKLGIKTENNPVDLGVRIEVKNSLVEDLTNNLHDFKIRYITNERRDLVRTFCVCPSGSVIMEKHLDYATVNGKTDKTSKTSNTNFAILVSMPFDEPFKDPNAYGRHLAKLSTLLSNGSVLVQTLADFHNKRRSKADSLDDSFVKPTLPVAAPGDLRLALTERFVAAISEMLEALDKFIPGINNGNNALIYGIEVKFYSRRMAINKNCETAVPGLYVIGDGSGYSRGILQSAMMGVIAARDIIEKGEN